MRVRKRPATANLTSASRYPSSCACSGSRTIRMRNGKILCRLHLEICRSRNAIARRYGIRPRLPEYSARRALARRAALIFHLPVADPRSRIGANLCGQTGQGRGRRRTEFRPCGVRSLCRYFLRRVPGQPPGRRCRVFGIQFHPQPVTPKMLRRHQ